MKRTGSWPRKTPMQRSSQLTRALMKRKRARATPEERNARKVVAARSEGRCEVCGQTRAGNTHHRRKAGRVWTPSNLLHVCGSGTTGCHGHIEGNPAASIEQGWWVPSHRDPATVPCWLSGRGWCLLSDDGDLTELDDEEVA